MKPFFFIMVWLGSAAFVQGASHLSARIKTCWGRWDADASNTLERREIVATIKDASVKGLEAAIAVTLYKQKYIPAGTGKSFSMAKEDVLAVTEDAAFISEVDAGVNRLGKLTRKLFTTGDPNLETFHQGQLGDCFLLANIGLLVNHRTEQFKSMFETLASGDIRVSYGNGEVVTVAPLTEGELLFGAAVNRNVGVWLNVFEKAWGERKQETTTSNEPGSLAADECLYSEFLNGGL